MNIDLLIRKLYDPKFDNKFLLSSIKNDFSVDEIMKFLKRGEIHPLVKKYFYGNPFPKGFNKLGIEFISPVMDFEKEFTVLVININKYFKEINSFIILRREFEKNILQKDYVHANDNLNSIEKEFGNSLWHLENKFIVEEYINGLEGNTEFLNNFTRQTNNSYSKILGYFLSLRAEHNISFNNYVNQLDHFTKGLGLNIEQYLNFRLNYLYKIETYDDLSVPISFDTIFPVIDKYETFIKLCQLVLVNEKYSEEKSIIKKLLVLIKDKIKDPLFDKILISNDLLMFEKTESESINSLEIFEQFNTGDYINSSQNALKYSQLYPEEFSYKEIFVKSLIYSKKNKSYLNEVTSLTNEVTFLVFDLLSRSENFLKAKLKIQKIITIHESSEWAKQIFCFVESDIGKKKILDFEKFRGINSRNILPTYYKILSAPSSRLGYLQLFNRRKHFNFIEVLIILEIATDSNGLNKIDHLDMPEYRKLLYKAIGHEKINLKNEAIEFYREIITGYPENFIIYNEALHNLLDCYYELNEYNSYLKLYVLNSFNDTHLKIVPQDIHKKIESRKFQGIDKSIYLPIFYFLTTSNTHLINLTIRHFLKSYDCKIPTEIIKFKDHFELSHLILFLNSICTQEILKFFTIFKGSKEILNERLGICRILLNLDKDNEIIYNEEIGLIAKNIVIMEGLRQVDESKIFVDEKGLRLNELKEIKNLFDRYLQIKEIWGNQKVLLLDLNSLKAILTKFSENSEEINETEKSTQTINVQFKYFKEIFLIVRDKFLFNSKYGLDTYLSTRIRHGTLLGQIRSKFQDYHLITQKDKDEEVYFENEYWSNKIFANDVIDKEKFNGYLSEFSDKIDTLTNELKNDLIQIRTEWQKNEGLFNYIFSDTILYTLLTDQYEMVTDYELFLDQIFKNLWEQTNKNLSLIREYIASKIKDQYLSYFEELENNLKSLNIDSQSFQELLNDIVSCKTNISWELVKISDWFQIKETNVKDFTIDKAIDTSIEITNRISENVKIINISKDINSYSIIKGINFISYFDLLRIFLDNMKYSENNSDSLEVKIFASEKDGFLVLRIINNLSDISDNNIEKIKRILYQKSQDLNSPDWDMERIKKEGSTGFYKAKKILLSDLQSEKNNFLFFVNENNDVEIQIFICLN